MRRVREVIVVEGKYDEIRVRSAVDATTVPTDGFGIFRDGARLSMLRRLAAQRTAEAVQALSVFGADADSLRQLAESLLHRDH